jgi:hypothetical protein
MFTYRIEIFEKLRRIPKDLCLTRRIAMDPFPLVNAASGIILVSPNVIIFIIVISLAGFLCRRAR